MMLSGDTQVASKNMSGLHLFVNPDYLTCKAFVYVHISIRSMSVYFVCFTFDVPDKTIDLMPSILELHYIYFAVLIPIW
jgi:hypothetical protein